MWCYCLINLYNRDELVSGGVALLQLLWEVAAGVEKVNRREGVGRGGGSIATPK
jgi:hypothetical protein